MERLNRNQRSIRVLTEAEYLVRRAKLAVAVSVWLILFVCLGFFWNGWTIGTKAIAVVSWFVLGAVCPLIWFWDVSMLEDIFTPYDSYRKQAEAEQRKWSEHVGANDD